MNRRELISLLGAAAWPLAARAQQKRVQVIGFLGGGSPGDYGSLLAAFRQALSAAGYVEGQNFTIEQRWAEERFDRLADLAADLVGSNVDVIVAQSDPSARAAKNATSTIPIVFFIGGNPIAEGLVASLARPGGNLTGVTIFGNELRPKRLELLSELVPQVRVIGIFLNAANPLAGAAPRLSADLQYSARAKDVRLQILKAGSEAEIEAAFATLVQLQAGALLLAEDPLFFRRREQFVALAARHAIPVIYYRREFVDAGGLISYGPSFAAAFHQIGTYAGKILNGAKTADLPVQQPTKFELVINLKTARALGLTVPPVLMAQADEVVE